MTGLGKLIRAEFRLLRRDPSIAFVVIIPVLLVTIFGLLPSTGQPSEDFGGGRFIDYYVPPIITLIIGMMALNALSSALATYRERGVLRKMAVTPVRPVALMVAQGIVNLALLTGVTVLVLAIGGIAFDVVIPRQLGGFALAFVLCVSAMFSIGLLISALAPNGKAANGIGTVAFFPLAFLAGLWTPGPMMPDVVRRISDFSPLGAGSQAMQRAWEGSFPEPLHLVVLLAFTLGVGFTAARLFRWQ
ncbi:ABC-2 type transport system permease protein [Kibdelosporangium banguiense]|uniref:Transport permease protein n=1 Tax=Kibdelosporangium banguiense TaxID=1365924 RepID=A0ABS4T7C1_9PSEU|nr:ABC transporter permease [Kibdelosporangium banguiense]MBP2320181.1 ABC-2 type transport system permease protein [Kibdelosporangium banguiense]